jgi:hypothetical protein
LLEAELLVQAQVVEDCASALLEGAWDRVKNGELKYRVCIWISLGILTLSLIAAILTSFTPLHDWLMKNFRCLT